MTESEIKTRKQWLTVLIVSGVMNVCYFAFHTLGDPAYSEFPNWVKQIILAINFTSILAFSYILYRCIYQKPGTKMILFLLIVAPIVMSVSILGYLFGKVPMPSNIWLWAHFLLSNGLGIWWYILNLKMRQINKKAQERAV